MRAGADLHGHGSSSDRPDGDEPGTDGPGRAEPGTDGPGSAEPDGAEPGSAEPSDDGPGSGTHARSRRAPALDDVALDLGRAERRGYPEAVLCDAKSVDQVARIAALWRDSGTPGPVLFTRVDEERAAAVLEELPDAHHDDVARMVVWPADPPAPRGGRVVVVAAGSSDLPVAREAELTARHLGRETSMVVDVGVAGLHRILARREELQDPAVRAIVVAAGMDGALPSVVAGLVSAPVIAVPTSVGYGASFGGVAALLTMLNSCAPGVAVVNIDNGYGAGHLAAQIAAPAPHPAD